MNSNTFLKYLRINSSLRTAVASTLQVLEFAEAMLSVYFEHLRTLLGATRRVFLVLSLARLSALMIFTGALWVRTMRVRRFFLLIGYNISVNNIVAVAVSTGYLLLSSLFIFFSRTLTGTVIQSVGASKLEWVLKYTVLWNCEVVYRLAVEGSAQTPHLWAVGVFSLQRKKYLIIFLVLA